MLVIKNKSRMRGTLLAAGRIELDGWFQGEIICSELIVGSDGYLLGNVSAREITVAGQIVGTAHTGRIRLLKGAFFEGDIYHTSIAKEAGATLIGETISTRGALKLPADLLALEAEAYREAQGQAAARKPAPQTPLTRTDFGPSLRLVTTGAQPQIRPLS